MASRLLGIGSIALIAAALLAASFAGRSSDARAQTPGGPSANDARPVEDDMHEFMEYAFQPTYLRLQKAMAAAPADNAGWKAIKADGLLLAEGGNLLLFRIPADEAEAWRRHSLAVRGLGGKLYQAGRTKDFPAARKHYEAMLQSCNRCHDDFAGGEHQLEP